MRFLFSSSQKQDDLIEADTEGSRARIQAAIDRAIQMPETPVPAQPEAALSLACEDVTEHAA